MIDRLLRSHLAILLLGGSVTIFGCGGGGSPTTPTPPPPPPPPPQGVFFTPNASPGENAIYLTGPDSTNPNAFTLEVHASEVTDLYGLGMDINFPNDLLSHKNNDSTIHEGTFLSENGQVATELIRDRQSGGLLIVGHTREGEVGGVDGSGMLFSLDFTTDAAGVGEFSIRRAQALDSELGTQEDVVWIAGSIEVRF